MAVSWLAFGSAVPPVVTAALEPVSLRVAATMAVTINTALTLALLLVRAIHEKFLLFFFFTGC